MAKAVLPGTAGTVDVFGDRIAALVHWWKDGSAGVRLAERLDRDLLVAVENAADEFGMVAIYWDVTEETTLNELITTADSVFEESVVNYAIERGQSAAVVRFSPPGEELEEGELPSVIADVRYETYGDNQWQRVNYPEVPVEDSPLFPSAPTSFVTLSDGTIVEFEPVTRSFPNDAARAGLNVRAIYPYLVLDGPLAPQAIELI